MRISDWSSDVCSSDLGGAGERATVALRPCGRGCGVMPHGCHNPPSEGLGSPRKSPPEGQLEALGRSRKSSETLPLPALFLVKNIGRATGRENMVQYV